MYGGAVRQSVIVVATSDFEVYHDVVGELRDRGVTFTTVETGEAFPERTAVVITAADEDLDVPDGADVVEADPDHPRPAVERALGHLRSGDGRIVVGIDPGVRPGVAVLAGETVIAAFQVPRGDVAALVRDEVADAVDPVVRIGDGARLDGARIVDEIEDVRVELVDETGTTPYLGTGANGMGDVLAAVNIARLEGEPIETREVEPTEGELQVIKDRSRDQSRDNREIDDALARRVATGDLSIQEALDEHREE